MSEILDLAALAHAWEAWARPKQMPPDTNWRSFGFCTGRGFGKTRSNCEFVVREVMAGRAREIAFAAQNLDETERIMIEGPSGLLACSPPWFPAEVVKGIVCWPNGARAIPMTPEVPGAPRGGDRDLVWLSEVAAWSAASREEFFSNMNLSLRRGLGRMVFDTTPRARNPLVRKLLERAVRDPAKHIVIRGGSRENADNLTAGVVAEWEAELGDTQKGREELEGIFHDDAEGALFKQMWIDRARRNMPTAWKRRILFVDPAISLRRSTDATGIVDLGLGVDDQVYAIEDLTDRMAAEVWGALLIERYVRNGCDCIGVERNRGGDLVAANIRASAERRGLRVEIVGAEAVTRHAPGVIYIKETIARRSKALRAEPVATLVEKGRVSFVNGADLTELEEQMTTWLPESSGDSPNALDAFVHGVIELAGLSRETKPKSDVVGAAKLQAMVTQPRPSAPTNISALLGRRGGGDRI
jgi:phage terminase large subunit-like protein